MGWQGELPQHIQEQLDVQKFGTNFSSPALLIKHDTPKGQDVQRFAGEEWEVKFWNEQLKSVLEHDFPSKEAQTDMFEQIIRVSANSLNKDGRLWLDH